MSYEISPLFMLIIFSIQTPDLALGTNVDPIFSLKPEYLLIFASYLWFIAKLMFWNVLFYVLNRNIGVYEEVCYRNKRHSESTSSRVSIVTTKVIDVPYSLWIYKIIETKYPQKKFSFFPFHNKIAKYFGILNSYLP